MKMPELSAACTGCSLKPGEESRTLTWDLNFETGKLRCKTCLLIDQTVRR